MHFQYILLVSFPCTHWWASCISPLLSIYARISVGKFSLLVEVALNLEVKNPKRNCLNKGSSQRFLPNSTQIPKVTTFFSHKMGQKQSCWWGDEVIVKWCLHLALRWLKRRNKFWVMLWEKEYKFGQVLWRCCKRIACQSLIHMTKENF